MIKSILKSLELKLENQGGKASVIDGRKPFVGSPVAPKK